MARVAASLAPGIKRPTERRPAARRLEAQRSLWPYWLAVVVAWALLGLAGVWGLDDVHHASAPSGPVLLGLSVAVAAWTVMVLSLIHI